MSCLFRKVEGVTTISKPQSLTSVRIKECILRDPNKNTASFVHEIHHCNQQVFVFEGLGFFELVFDDILVIYYVFGYEVHCQYLTSMHFNA